ncbi:helix-turn-helix domain-containing protein [Alcaligenes parafaecalis]|uniref:Cupin domain-containing protein n=1 Tax=Alcaligenes parafaecalis TaxID=171260 RepID=A0ABT3VUI0_9BURK|nr:cupin domain-containing protein [Alcaligenes parafaecalis]MCX5465398.1 cupin domain-containing protein [Alcaligenes parafaecalis]
MSLGKVIHAARKRAGLSLRDLEKATGVSLAKLSKIENDKATLRHPELFAVSEALAIPAVALLGALNGSEQTATLTGRRAITRANEGRAFERSGRSYRVLCGDMSQPDNLFWQVTITEKAPGTPASFLAHPGEEFIYVLKGQVELHSALYEPVILGPGDSMLFDASVPHAYFAVRREASVLMSNSTPKT